MEKGDDRLENEKIYTYDEAVELTGHGRYNYLLLTACSIITNAFALDMFGYSVVVAASSCDLRLGLTETGVLASAPFAGVLFAFPWGYYADTRGRRRALLLSTGIGFVFATLSSFAGSWQFMLVVKLLGCSFSTASFTLAMTLLGECTDTRHRTRYLSIMMSFNLASEFVSFALAYLVLPLTFNIPVPWMGITYRPWRLFTLIMALPLGFGASLMYYLYESPKYLANKGETVKALEVLKKIYEFNGGKRENYPVDNIVTSDDALHETKSFWSSVTKHTVPIFRPPLLKITGKLFYLIALCCSVNNVYVMWYPTIANFFFNSLSEGWTSDMSFCERIKDITTSSHEEDPICTDTISDNTIYSGMLYGLFYCTLNLAVAKVASRRRLVLIATLMVAGVSGILVDLRHPIANMIFFTLLQATSLGVGCVASYFVDMYPTSHRGIAISLGMMVARITSFAGANLIAAVITNHCRLTFYCSSAFVFSGILVSIFLPPDKKITD